MNTASSLQYERISAALQWLCQHQQEQPSLTDLARHVGLSPQHFQRLFQQWAGVTPKQYLKYLTRTQALKRLQAGQSVLDAALESGLSGPGRLHDLILTTHAMTPGEAKRGGQGVAVNYGYGMTPFGEALLAWNKRGICFLGFCMEKSRQQVYEQFTQQWPDASVSHQAAAAESQLAEIFATHNHTDLKVWLRGSPFQLLVWEALLNIPTGTHCSYGQLATFAGRTGASRAVGTAIGRNPVAWLIPCHRVITRLGATGGYRWGTYTKQAIIAFEAARADHGQSLRQTSTS